MEIVHQIDRWLATGADYDAGVTLYARFGTSAFLKNYFVSTSLRDVAAIKLHESLLALREAQQPATAPAMVREVPTPAPQPSQVEEIKKQVKHLLAKIAAKHGDLVNANTDATRFEVAKELIRLSKRRQELWHALDTYDATGQMPGRPSWERDETKHTQIVASMSPHEVVKRLMNIRPMITKAKQNVEKHSDSDEKREKYLAKLSRLQQEHDLLMTLRDAQPTS